MPSNWLNVPHFQQEHEYSCVAACVRMVLAHYGNVRLEAELRLLLDTLPTGTRAGNVMRLSGSDFEVYLRPSNLLELQQVLAANQPPIVFLQTGPLEYWSMDIFHTAVLTGLDTTTAAIHDPYFATAPQTTSLRSFEKAWAQTGQFTAFIRPREKVVKQTLDRAKDGEFE
jgi:ABC-type bacteriocin/lantibiotic exporter with double-glycine peptidase domain